MLPVVFCYQQKINKCANRNTEREYFVMNGLLHLFGDGFIICKNKYIPIALLGGSIILPAAK